MTEAERKELFKVNSISIALNLVICILGALISLGGLLLIWEEKDLGGLIIHIINHMIIYAFVIFYTCYGYRIKRVNLLRIVAIVFAILNLISAIIFLGVSDFAIPMQIFSMLASAAFIYFAIRVDHKLERNIALGLIILFFIIYGITGCCTINLNYVDTDYRFFTCLSLFSPAIVSSSIIHSFYITKTPRFHVMNPPKESEIERILD